MMDPDLKNEFFIAFTQCIEGCAPDALKSMPKDELVWTIEMQADHLLEGFDISCTEGVAQHVLEHWDVMDWDERRNLVASWGKSQAYTI